MRLQRRATERAVHPQRCNAEHGFVAGTVVLVPPGHDAWVLGGEAVVLVDWNGATPTPAPSHRVRCVQACWAASQPPAP